MSQFLILVTGLGESQATHKNDCDALDSNVNSDTRNPKDKTLRDGRTNRKQQVRKLQKTKNTEEGSKLKMGGTPRSIC